MDLAREDPRLDAALLTGSLSSGEADGWSDIDVAFVVSNEDSCPQVARDWVDLCERQFDPAHRYEVTFGTTLVLGFLMTDGLALDVSFTPTDDFAVWADPARVLFDRTGSATHAAGHPQSWPVVPDWFGEAGFAWHDVLHACAAADRRRLWQSLFYLQRVRNRTLALASQRHGHDADEFKHVDDLPASERDPLLAGVVGSLDRRSLVSAIDATTKAFLAELRRGDPDLAERLEEPLSACIRAAWTATTN